MSRPIPSLQALQRNRQKSTDKIQVLNTLLESIEGAQGFIELDLNTIIQKDHILFELDSIGQALANLDFETAQELKVKQLQPILQKCLQILSEIPPDDSTHHTALRLLLVLSTKKGIPQQLHQCDFELYFPVTWAAFHDDVDAETMLYLLYETAKVVPLDIRIELPIDIMTNSSQFAGRMNYTLLYDIIDSLLHEGTCDDDINSVINILHKTPAQSLQGNLHSILEKLVATGRLPWNRLLTPQFALSLTLRSLTDPELYKFLLDNSAEITATLRSTHVPFLDDHFTMPSLMRMAHELIMNSPDESMFRVALNSIINCCVLTPNELTEVFNRVNESFDYGTFATKKVMIKFYCALLANPTVVSSITCDLQLSGMICHRAYQFFESNKDKYSRSILETLAPKAIAIPPEIVGFSSDSDDEAHSMNEEEDQLETLEMSAIIHLTPDDLTETDQVEIDSIDEGEVTSLDSIDSFSISPHHSEGSEEEIVFNADPIANNQSFSASCEEDGDCVFISASQPVSPRKNPFSFGGNDIIYLIDEEEEDSEFIQIIRVTESSDEDLDAQHLQE